MKNGKLSTIFTLITLFTAPELCAETASVAVASNFTAPMKVIAAEFEKESGHKAQLAFASSGKIFAQIKNGAPFDLFLSADSQKPARLEQEGLSLPNSRFTYALGSLALWSATPRFVDPKATVLGEDDFAHLAIANPSLAPYGAATQETLKKLGHWDRLQKRLVRGENIAQTYQFVSTANAKLGFVALSQVMKEGNITTGSVWPVPAILHSPIRQDAVLLMKGKDNRAAKELLSYLKSARAASIIRAYGYRL